MKKSTLNVQKLVLSSIYISIFLVLTFVPYTGYISIVPGVVSITILPVFIAIATMHLGLLGAVSTSIAFGLGSYFKALAGFGSPLFVNPEFAIVPRLLLGIIVYLVYKALGNKMKLWKSLFLSGFTVIANTTLITGMYFIVSLYNIDFNKSIKVWLTIIYINFLVELGVALALTTFLYPSLKHLITNARMKQENMF